MSLSLGHSDKRLTISFTQAPATQAPSLRASQPSSKSQHPPDSTRRHPVMFPVSHRLGGALRPRRGLQAGERHWRTDRQSREVVRAGTTVLAQSPEHGSKVKGKCAPTSPGVWGRRQGQTSPRSRERGRRCLPKPGACAVCIFSLS